MRLIRGNAILEVLYIFDDASGLGCRGWNGYMLVIGLECVIRKDM